MRTETTTITIEQATERARETAERARDSHPSTGQRGECREDYCDTADTLGELSGWTGEWRDMAASVLQADEAREDDRVRELAESIIEECDEYDAVSREERLESCRVDRDTLEPTDDGERYSDGSLSWPRCDYDADQCDDPSELLRGHDHIISLVDDIADALESL